MIDAVTLLDALKEAMGGVSDYEVARKLGFSKATVSQWRSRRGIPSDESAQRIAEFLGIPPMFVIASMNAERACAKDVAEGRISEAPHMWRDLAGQHNDESVMRIVELLRTRAMRKEQDRLVEIATEAVGIAAARRDEKLTKAARALVDLARKSVASILLVCLGLMTVHGKASAAGVSVELVGELSNQPSMYYAQLGTRRRRRLAKLLPWLKALVAAPLHPPCAWNRCMASPP